MSQISAEWGAQRIKGLSVSKIISHFIMSKFRPAADVARKVRRHRSIEKFLYPKYGPGQLWECVADHVRRDGGEILERLGRGPFTVSADKVTCVEAVNSHDR